MLVRLQKLVVQEFIPDFVHEFLSAVSEDGGLCSFAVAELTKKVGEGVRDL